MFKHKALYSWEIEDLDGLYDSYYTGHEPDAFVAEEDDGLNADMLHRMYFRLCKFWIYNNEFIIFLD